jgi:Flp pilus assembly pilin Flp
MKHLPPGSREHKKRGQGLVEYIALTALVAIVCIGAVKALGTKLQRKLNQIASSFEQGVPASRPRPGSKSRPASPTWPEIEGQGDRNGINGEP